MIRTTLFATTALLLTTPALAAQQADWTLVDGQRGAPANDAANDFVHPLTSPYIHEDSFVTNDIRVWGVYHKFDSDVIGGDAQVYAAQIRVAITDSLQLVAYKDGWIGFDSAALNNEEGMNNLAAGVKWAFVQDQKNQLFAAAGIGYEFATGDDEVLQNDEVLRLWASVNKGVGAWHLGATLNGQFARSAPSGPLGGSDVLSLHLHADYRVSECFSPVAEVNYYHTLSSSAVPFSGVDVINIDGGDGEDVVTAALGAEYRCKTTGLKLRAAYEVPVTDSVDLFDYRVTGSVVLSF